MWGKKRARINARKEEERTKGKKKRRKVLGHAAKGPLASRVTELPETNSKRGRTYDREVGRRKREEPLSRGYVCLDPGDGKGGEEEIPAKETEKGRREEAGTR